MDNLEHDILDYEASLYDLYNENCRNCDNYNNTISTDRCHSCSVDADMNIIIKILSELREKI